MNGPYDLTKEKIDEKVTRTSAGNYALGYSKNNTFYVKYVGRSDNDVNGRLKDWIGDYKRFKYSYATSAKAAYEKECQNYHDFGGSDDLDNQQHPKKSAGKNWKCPVCEN